MTFEVWDPSTPDVTFKPADVSFPAFEFYKQQAAEIAEYIRSVEVSEDNVKEVKKELAQARKITDELNKRRIAIKKEILVSFDAFEGNVKDLSAIISEAEGELRSKVHELEELEREQKKAQIRKLWDRRAGQYQINNMIPNAFEQWMIPQYLNKTVSMKNVEKEMISWLENTEGDIDTLKALGEDYLVEYLGTLDLKQAIAEVNRRNEIREIITETEDEEVAATFIVIGAKDITMTEMLLKNNNITFTRR